jgi:uncharacterized protein YqfA (UPF0365 family)
VDGVGSRGLVLESKVGLFYMSLIRMLLSRVDPFAVYAAERELVESGIQIPRERLVSHYLVQGQLRTLVSKLTGSP